MTEPTLIFLPGLGEDRRLFQYQTAAFPNSYAADWIDLLPDEPLEQYAIRYATSIRTKLDKQPPSSVIVCGHSLGGMIAPYVARELDAAGYTPLGCILLGSVRKPEQFPRRYYCWWLLMCLCPPLRPVVLFMGQLFPRLLVHVPWLIPWFIPLPIVQSFAEMPTRRLSRLTRMMLHWAYRRRLPEENVPVFDKPILQAHGTNDWLLPIRRTNPDIRIKGGNRNCLFFTLLFWFQEVLRF